VTRTLHDATYYPNQPGARTLHDARPLLLNHKRVSVAVSRTGRTLTLFAGTTLIHEEHTPAHVRTPADVHQWATDYLTKPIIPAAADPLYHEGMTRRDRAALHTAWGVSRTLPRWATLLRVGKTTLRRGITRHGSLEAYLTARGLGHDDVK
jgi:hypothetical protein